jgi:NAD(P)-dependent dehydrogenase (short-subunit alcohol dehydrogenase family)
MSPSGSASKLAEELGGIGLDGSVTQPADLDRLVSTTLDVHGRIDAVVNNTGHAPKGPLLDLSDDDWLVGFDLIALSVIRIARLVTPIMRRQGGGATVNISTFAAFEPDARFPISATLRAALGSFTKLYADQHASDGIRMNNVLPGFVDSFPEDPDTVRSIPMGRYGRVEEIAKTVAFLLSADAGYITGQNIRVDGGITRSV